jgi:hypothetical protein
MPHFTIAFDERAWLIQHEERGKVCLLMVTLQPLNTPKSAR